PSWQGRPIQRSSLPPPFARPRDRATVVPPREPLRAILRILPEWSAILLRSRCVLLPVFHVFIEPLEFLPEHVLDRFLPAIPMRCRGQEHKPNRSAVSADRLIHAIALDRERARVVVGLAVDQQDRIFDLVREKEGRHAGVCVRRFPERSTLALEPERRERSVI